MTGIPSSHFPMSISAIAGGSVSPSEAVAAAYERIEKWPDKAVFIELVPREEALAAAKNLEAAGPEGKPLYGVPFAVKNNIDAAGLATSAACPPFAYQPTEDATVVARLREAGGILIGSTNMDQFATGLVGTRSPHGAPRCVFDAAMISGGSSSGSGVAVAAGLVAFSLGTDTAGSGRVPAAFNNIVGVKPTRGLLPTRGVVPACASLDCVSIFARDMGEADIVRRVAQGPDPLDPWSRTAEPRPLPASPRVGVLRPEDRDFKGNGAAADAYARAIERAAALGWTIAEIDYAPLAEAAALLYAGPWVAEREAAVGDFIREHAADCDPTVAEIILGGGARSARDAFDGVHALQQKRLAADALWHEIDLLLLPTVPTQYSVAEISEDPIGRNSHLGHYTNFANLLDLAAVAVPSGLAGNRAYGVTLFAPAFTDADLALAADRLHRTLENPTAGATGAPLGPQLDPDPEAIHIAVVGAHLSGQPLNGQLTSRGGVFVETTRTAPDYRLYALAGTVPPKPGLIREEGFSGPGLEVEVWALSHSAFGAFTAEVPSPLGIGTVTLADGRAVKGFICEPAGLAGAEEITRFGGWRAYRASRA